MTGMVALCFYLEIIDHHHTWIQWACRHPNNRAAPDSGEQYPDCQYLGDVVDCPLWQCLWQNLNKKE